MVLFLLDINIGRNGEWDSAFTPNVLKLNQMLEPLLESLEPNIAEFDPLITSSIPTQQQLDELKMELCRQIENPPENQYYGATSASMFGI